MEGVTSGPIGGGTPYTGTDAAKEAKNDNGKGVEGLSDTRPQTPPPGLEADKGEAKKMAELEISKQKDVTPQVNPPGGDSERTDSIVEGETPAIAGDTGEQGAEEQVASSDTEASKETATTDQGEKVATGDKPTEGGEGESQSGEGEQQTA
ncbi:hypothetical protein [Endozoicomonas elysicola]|uniref:Uncharacterized protein n=1 Tax=Endozoicomonas elysicola TaxID=305900 RepID=A0A081KAL1_9GAMM|nr:hypothetical protein [Endozoicomonas elysicola]KEI71187.1 hypothetical protein GV64_10925 [Endozoicomonas elysicola]